MVRVFTPHIDLDAVAAATGVAYSGLRLEIPKVAPVPVQVNCRGKYLIFCSGYYETHVCP